LTEGATMDKTELPQEVIDRVIARRGRLHVFDRLDPARTALVVIDMQEAFLAPGAPSEVAAARAIVPNINRLAAALRQAGGIVAWIQATFSDDPMGGWETFFRDM